MAWCLGELHHAAKQVRRVRQRDGNCASSAAEYEIGDLSVWMFLIDFEVRFQDVIRRHLKTDVWRDSLKNK